MTGTGTLANPYIISDVDDLQDMENDLTAYYELGSNINALATSGWNGGLGFEPVGTVGTPFTGSLDSKGFTISDLFINRPLLNQIGLFGTVDGATLTDVILADVDITGRDEVGGLVGYIDGTGSVVSDCHVTGAVEGDDWVGGLIGQDNAIDTVMADCDTSGTVTGGDDGIGGLIGGIISINVTISDCHSTATITSGAGAWSVGGAFGQVWTTGTITRCYATGDVTGGGNRIGGFAGYIREITTISKCYATGDAESTFPLDYVGGFAGESGAGAITDCYAKGNATGGDYIGGFIGHAGGDTITNCYSTGVPSGVADVGGFCGSNDGTITDCFWDITTSGEAASDGGTSKTTAQMNAKSTFRLAGWDFIKIWAIRASINDSYPYFAKSRVGNLIIDQMAHQHCERMQI